MTKPTLSCCDVINFGIGVGKGGRKSLQRRWDKWGFPFTFPKFMTSQQDNMGFVSFNILQADQLNSREAALKNCEDS